MTKYKIECKECGLSIRVAFEQQLQMDCQKCNGVILPIHSFSAKASVIEVQTTSRNQKPLPQIADYQMIRKIGEGAMGNVILAQHITNNERVVFKFLKLHSIPEKKRQKLMESFIREAQILSTLDHRCIAKFKGCGSFEGHPYFIMEYIDGVDLLTLLQKQKTLDVAHILEIMYRLSGALSYGLSSKIIHRDLKPANIMLTAWEPPYMPKLIDFGLAKCLDETHRLLTRTGDVMGTPYYMSPEQAHDSKNITFHADIYSLGAIMYHCVAGRPPFYNRGAVHQLLKAVREETPIPNNEWVPHLPKMLLSVINKCMARLPQDRYQTYEELREDLKFNLKIWLNR